MGTSRAIPKRWVTSRSARDVQMALPEDDVSPRDQGLLLTVAVVSPPGDGSDDEVPVRIELSSQGEERHPDKWGMRGEACPDHHHLPIGHPGQIYRARVFDEPENGVSHLLVGVYH